MDYRNGRASAAQSKRRGRYTPAMDQVPPPPVPTQLIVFADDWGRHPSSSQHLIRELLPHYPTLWVNTVGTRRPQFTLADLKRAAGVFSSWFFTSRREADLNLPDGLRVIAPKMYPGYRNRLQRKYNAASVLRAVHRDLLEDHRHVVVTTLPTTADLIGPMHVDRWVYYCVDAYNLWPGTDHDIMTQMDKAQVALADELVAVSDVIAQYIKALGRSSVSTNHGVDLAFWRTPSKDSVISDRWPQDERPVALFWGLLDGRMDSYWLTALAKQPEWHVVLAGPKAETYQGIIADPYCEWIGPVAQKDLPAHAASSQVLIMPYVDEPVTQMMQPLKLKEYLATMKPVVVRDLPSTREWADCCDLAADAETFVDLVEQRIKTGTPPEQIEARKRRLARESWTSKAAQLAAIINAD